MACKISRAISPSSLAEEIARQCGSPPTTGVRARRVAIELGEKIAALKDHVAPGKAEKHEISSAITTLSELYATEKAKDASARILSPAHLREIEELIEVEPRMLFDKKRAKPSIRRPMALKAAATPPSREKADGAVSVAAIAGGGSAHKVIALCARFDTFLAEKKPREALFLLMRNQSEFSDELLLSLFEKVMKNDPDVFLEHFFSFDFKPELMTSFLTNSKNETFILLHQFKNGTLARTKDFNKLTSAQVLQLVNAYKDEEGASQKLISLVISYQASTRALSDEQFLEVLPVLFSFDRNHTLNSILSQDLSALSLDKKAVKKAFSKIIAEAFEGKRSNLFPVILNHPNKENVFALCSNRFSLLKINPELVTKRISQYLGGGICYGTVLALLAQGKHMQTSAIQPLARYYQGVHSASVRGAGKEVDLSIEKALFLKEGRTFYTGSTDSISTEGLIEALEGHKQPSYAMLTATSSIGSGHAMYINFEECTFVDPNDYDDAKETLRIHKFSSKHELITFVGFWMKKNYPEYSSFSMQRYSQKYPKEFEQVLDALENNETLRVAELLSENPSFIENDALCKLISLKIIQTFEKSKEFELGTFFWVLATNNANITSLIDQVLDKFSPKEIKGFFFDSLLDGWVPRAEELAKELGFSSLENLCRNDRQLKTVIRTLIREHIARYE